MRKVLVWPVALYGCGTCTLRRTEIEKLDALEMWIWKQLERVCWQDRVTNEKVLQMVTETKCLIRTIREMKKNWIGHGLRRDGLLRDVLEGRLLGKRPRGKSRIGMI